MSNLEDVKKTESRETKLTDFCLAILIITFTFAFSKRYIFGGYEDFYIDENMFISDGYFILNGLVPYKDFFENKQVIIMLMNAIGLFLFGLENCAFKLMPFVLLFPGIIFFYLALTKININRLFAFIISIYTSFMLLNPEYQDYGNNHTETYGMIFAIYGFSSFCWFKNKVFNGLLVSHILSGFFFALSVFTKEQYLISLSPLVLSIVLEENSLKVNFKKLLSVILGGMILVCGIVIYLIFTNSFVYYLDILDFNLGYSKSFADIVGRNLPKTPSELYEYDYNHLKDKFKNFTIFKPLWLFYASLLYFNKVNIKTVLCILCILCGAYGISLGHLFWNHSFIVGIFSFIVPAILGAKNFSDYMKSTIVQNHSVIIFIITLLYLTFSTIAIGSVVDELEKKYTPKNIGERLVTFKEKVMPVLEKYTKTHEPIPLIGYRNLYVVSKRFPLSKDFVFLDNNFNVSTEKLPSEKKKMLLIEELSKNMPKVIYIQPEFPHAEMLKREIIYPFITKNKYFNCGNGAYLKNKPSEDEIKLYCNLNN